MDENVTEVAEYTFKSGKAKQVILLEHLPRYDTDSMIRPELARLANELIKARDNSEFANHILVDQHSGLECIILTSRGGTVRLF